MATFVSQSIRDDGLKYPGLQTGLVLHFTDGAPADRAAAIAGSLASVALTGGDLPVVSGAGNLRAIQVAAKSGITPTGTGNINHANIIDDTELLTTNEVTTQAVSPTGDINSPTYQIQLPDSVVAP